MLDVDPLYAENSTHSREKQHFSFLENCSLPPLGSTDFCDTICSFHYHFQAIKLSCFSRPTFGFCFFSLLINKLYCRVFVDSPCVCLISLRAKATFGCGEVISFPYLCFILFLSLFPVSVLAVSWVLFLKSRARKSVTGVTS